MKNRMWIGCVVLAAAITGCGSSQERKVVVARSAQTTPPPPMQAHDDMWTVWARVVYKGRKLEAGELLWPFRRG